MLSEICWACQKSHAKRKCPAANDYICSLCCGSKRKKEINCPDECQYLAAGKRHWIKKLQISPAQIDFWRTHFDIVHNIQLAILQVKTKRITDLKDFEVKEAFENLIKTYETEERRIIYEYKSSNYRIQTIIDNVQNIINQHRYSEQNTDLSITSTRPKSGSTQELNLRKVALNELIASLKFVLNLINVTVTKNLSNNAFFDFITHFTSNSLQHE